MTLHRPSVHILVHREGALESRSYRVPLWAFRAGAIALGIALTTLLLGLLWYLPIVRTAARVPGLQRDIARLEEDNAKIRELVAAIDSAESRYAKMRRMIGADIVPDPVALRSTLPIAPPVRARFTSLVMRSQRSAKPYHWPLDESGFVTRGQVGSGTGDEVHPGIDIAVPIGSIVRASSGGDVLQAGSDPEYGLFVLVAHADSYQTMYGHLSRITATAGEKVASGQVIGISGNSGRSSAPHLHFEIRQNGQSLDPLSMVKEGT